jgi:hypothetical protein
MTKPGPILYVTALLIVTLAFMLRVDVGLWPLLPCLPLTVFVVRSWWRERGVRVTDADLEQLLRGA